MLPLPRYWYSTVHSEPREGLEREDSARGDEVFWQSWSFSGGQEHGLGEKDVLTWEGWQKVRRLEVEVGAPKEAGLQGTWLPDLR